MVKTMGYGSRQESKEMHTKIVGEYELMREANDGKNIKKILDILAKKYGYSSGQAVRNMIRLFYKNQSKKLSHAN